jgi:adenosylhomocysteine nucleosidase
VSTVLSIQRLIVVTGLAFEARVAAGPSVSVICSSGVQQLVTSLRAAIARGCHGIISFGTAGGLAPHLPPGHWVVASSVVGEQQFPACPIWSQKLLQALPGAIHGRIAGVDSPVGHSTAKRVLRDGTGAVAVDMESHIAASLAAAHGLPFAACRVIIDPAHRTLPPAALLDLRPDRTPDVVAVIRSLAQRPIQLPALLRTAMDARTARAELRRGRRILGPGFGFPDFSKLQLDVP